LSSYPIKLCIDDSIRQGASGGPLVYMNKAKTWVQIGIGSYGNDDDCVANPSVFARTSFYLGWISKKVGKGEKLLVSFKCKIFTSIKYALKTCLVPQLNQ